LEILRKKYSVKNILCVVNTSLNDTCALEHVAKLAENNQARLTVVEVIDEIPPGTKLFERTMTSAALQEKNSQRASK